MQKGNTQVLKDEEIVKAVEMAGNAWTVLFKKIENL
jgi:hypothetical protein